MLISQIILLVIILVAFSIIIYFVIRAFKTSCPSGLHFDKNFNKCVPNCSPPQINGPDSNCACPNSTDTFIDGKCVPLCSGGKPDVCGSTCYNKNSQTCLSDGTLCFNSLTCGDSCCGIHNGELTTCTNGSVVFKKDDHFILTEKSQDITVTIPKGIYIFGPAAPVTPSTNMLESYNKYNIFANPTTLYPNDGVYQTRLGYFLSNASPNHWIYNVTSDDSNNLIFTVTSNSNFQPSFNFSIMDEPSKIGFDKTNPYPFSNNILKSVSPININMCDAKPCDASEPLCGALCCDPENCVSGECCSPLDNKEICGTGTTKSCCPRRPDGTSNCCNGICCDYAAGQECQNGKCLVSCSYPDKQTGKKVYCDPLPKAGQKTGAYCMNLTNSNNSYCAHKDCVFHSVDYIPPEVIGPGHLGTQDSRSLPVCQSATEKDSDGSPTLYSVFKDSKSLVRTELSPYDSEKSLHCTATDCESRLNEFGVDSVTTDSSNNCLATFDCAQLLSENSNKCPFGSADKQCCYSTNDESSFTGQVCADDGYPYAVYEGNACNCVKGWGCFLNGANCGPIKKGSTYNGRVFASLTDCSAAGSCSCKAGYDPASACSQPIQAAKVIADAGSAKNLILSILGSADAFGQLCASANPGFLVFTVSPDITLSDCNPQDHIPTCDSRPCPISQNARALCYSVSGCFATTPNFYFTITAGNYRRTCGFKMSGQNFVSNGSPVPTNSVTGVFDIGSISPIPGIVFFCAVGVDPY